MSNHHLAETMLLEGPDARAFAHAQFSSKVDSLSTGHWQFSAWLDPQGRVRAFFHVAMLGEERYLLLLRGGNAASMVKELQRYVFRSKVRITALLPRIIVKGSSAPLYELRQEPDALTFGCGDHSMAISAEGSSDDAWRLPQLRAGWPWLIPASLGEFLPEALSLQRLGAVAVDKGCYPGQEIVARLHFRGGHKRHMHRGKLSHAVDAGDALLVEGREVGRVLFVVCTEQGNEALLVLNDDVAEQIHAGLFNAFDNALALELLASWPAQAMQVRSQEIVKKS